MWVGDVFLVFLIDFREIMLYVDSFVELIFKVGFKVLLLTATFA